MFSVKKYILLNLTEYVGYILDNLECLDNIRKIHKEDLKVHLLKEIDKLVDGFVNSFDVYINRESILQMKKQKEYIDEYDPNHLINSYDVFLANKKISVYTNDDCLIVTFRIGDIIVNKYFELNKYLQNRKFNSSLEAYTPIYDCYYMWLHDGKVLMYNKVTKFKMMANFFTDEKMVYPNIIYVVCGNEELVFFNVLSEINDYIFTKKANTEKIK